MLILIVEDDYLIANYMGGALAEADCLIAYARSAETALDTAMHERPALAVVDLGLSDGMSGPELARALAAFGIPVIICSGYPSKWVREQMHGTKITAFLPKPILEGELVAAVRTALAKV